MVNHNSNTYYPAFQNRLSLNSIQLLKFQFNFFNPRFIHLHYCPIPILIKFQSVKASQILLCFNEFTFSTQLIFIHLESNFQVSQNFSSRIV